MRISLKGGKTAPRILQDLISYDPRPPYASNYVAISAVPFHDASKDDDNPPLPDGSCQHQWAMKKNQAIIPEGTRYEPSPSIKWYFPCYCAKCRCHLDLILVFKDNAEFHPCPSEDRPLHHFVYFSDPSLADSAYLREPTQEARTESAKTFRCSASNCGALLSVNHRLPRLKDGWVSLLTDRLMIKARAEKAITSDPDKFQGHAAPSPGTVLETLCRLIVKALDGSERKPYPRDGKSFLLNLGEPCAGLLEFLGFSSDGGPWQWPQLSESTRTRYTDPDRKLLDDVREEIYVLMLARPDDERRSAKFNFTPVLAQKDIRLALGCDEYKENAKSRTVDTTAMEHPCYASLGSVVDFHDELILFAYDRQVSVDPLNAPYYLECLQTIAEGRDSEDLSTRAAIEESAGRISLRDIRSAYGNLGLDHDNGDLVDDTIIGCFQARVADAPKQEPELRRALRIIGSHRSSLKIQSIAAQTVNNYEQALSFLEANDATPDDFIVTFFAMIVESRPSDDATARQAVALIANHRKSKALKHWLDTGALGQIGMDTGQAYARLDISDRKMEDEMIITVFNVHAEEQPSQAEELRRALSTIAKERNSKTLLDFAGLDADDSPYPLREWPVALKNIGNTCYLNSLLQFYFSIKPFRDLVLNIDGFMTPTDGEYIKMKRVGGRSVSRKEIERAQRLAVELRKLFSDLISSPTRSVRPDTEVARLTLLTPKAEIARRQSIRQSLTNAERPIFPEAGDTLYSDAMQGPMNPKAAQGASNDIEMEDRAQNTASPNHILHDGLDNSSSETLVDESAAIEDAMALEAPSGDSNASPPDAIESTTSLGGHTPDQEANESRYEAPTRISPSSLTSDLAQKEVALSAEQTPEVDNQVPPRTVMNGPPRQPPPIPPRPKLLADPGEAVREAEFAAQQQDVNEIAYNVLNQLQCAIKPQKVDDSGEQIDQIKQLFYGKQKTYITSQSGEVRSKEEYMSDVRVNVQGGPLDIYTALDGAFDVEDVVVAGGIEPKYYTISHLPPILQIHIQRGQYDAQTKKQFKSNTHLELKETIYMDRYMDTSDVTLLRRRKESWQWKQQLSKLQSRRDQLIASDMGLDMSEVLECASGYLHQLGGIDGEHAIDIPPMLFEALKNAAEEAKAELEAIQTLIVDLRAKISLQFVDLRQIPYRLAAVFIHRGSSNAGHYWIYIYDFKADIWRKYNDERVTPVRDIGEIFNPSPDARPPTPYFVVYVKDDLKDSLIDPVCRNIVEAPAVESKDISMDDYEPIDLIDTVEQPHHSVPTSNGIIGPTANLGWDDSQKFGGGW